MIDPSEKDEHALFQGKAPEDFFNIAVAALKKHPNEPAYNLSFSHALFRARFKSAVLSMYEYSDTIAPNKASDALIFWKNNRIAFVMETYQDELDVRLGSNQPEKYVIAIYNTLPGTLATIYLDIPHKPNLAHLVYRCISEKEAMKLDFDPYNQEQAQL